jgi:peptidoglycan/LPS O-acetylase OafA/YrhL
MNRDTSVYLDAVRFLAALAVFIGHIEKIWAPGLIPFAADMGTPAVGIFLVLSGFVIAHTVAVKETDARSYFLSRAARIYSVVVPVLMMTLLIDIAGRWLVPDAYVLFDLGSWKEPLKLLLSLTFINQAWQWNLTPGSCGPFWSLAYEVPYYVIFGLWFFGRTVRWRLLAALLMVAAGPYVALLFTLWLLGFGCYHLCRAVTLSQTQGRVLFLLSLLSCALLAVRKSPYYAQFFMAGVPFAISIIGFSSSTMSISRWARPIRWMAGATFTLYLLHYPLGVLLQALLPITWPLGTRWLMIGTAILSSIFLFAQFTERRKDIWYRAFARLLSAAPKYRMPHLGAASG